MTNKWACGSDVQVGDIVRHNKDGRHGVCTKFQDHATWIGCVEQPTVNWPIVPRSECWVLVRRADGTMPMPVKIGTTIPAPAVDYNARYREFHDACVALAKEMAPSAKLVTDRGGEDGAVIWLERDKWQDVTDVRLDDLSAAMRMVTHMFEGYQCYFGMRDL